MSHIPFHYHPYKRTREMAHTTYIGSIATTERRKCYKHTQCHVKEVKPDNTWMSIR